MQNRRDPNPRDKSTRKIRLVRKYSTAQHRAHLFNRPSILIHNGKDSENSQLALQLKQKLRRTRSKGPPGQLNSNLNSVQDLEKIKKLSDWMVKVRNTDAVFEKCRIKELSVKINKNIKDRTKELKQIYTLLRCSYESPSQTNSVIS